jgi:hypothetical protein
MSDCLSKIDLIGLPLFWNRISGLANNPTNDQPSEGIDNLRVVE